MILRRSIVEHPFATIKYRIFGHPRLLLRGRNGARIEIGLAVMAYNLKRMTNVLGAIKLTQNWSARLEMCQWIRETLDKESVWDEARSTNLSRW
jgi:hypothetical protein